MIENFVTLRYRDFKCLQQVLPLVDSRTFIRQGRM